MSKRRCCSFGALSPRIQPRTLEQRREELVALRGRWEAKANEHLERAGQRERIDMRSYTAQGKDAIP
ncbi:MobA/MobL family protein, partial [Salmonella enterica]|nr:MobA/MobL family protein [Salmonella enterica]EHR7764119.1 MobA/MobL family protein [Salmonella enterica]